MSEQEHSDISKGSLTPDQVAEYTDALTRHYGERVAPVSDYCQGFYDWHEAIRAKVERLKAGKEYDSTGHDLEQWEGVLVALATLGFPIGKSSMLARRIYGGEKLRTEMCPEHKGQWCGVPFDPTPCGCDLTGWVRAER